MSAERTGLRFRLLAIVLAAALAPIAPLAIVLLLQVRDALYARRMADARARVVAAARAVRESCAAADAQCAGRFAAATGGRIVSGPCAARTSRARDQVVLCEEANHGLSIELGEDLAPVREQLRVLDARLLAILALFVAVLVTIAVYLLERGVVRRLGEIDQALEAVGAEQGGPNLLPEGGDAVGRVGAAVNRLGQRLREERARTRAQIDELRAAREEVARSERLASVGQLAAGVAHEVGNPVAALIGYAALMRERLAQGKDVAEYAGRVEREAGRIDRILRDLLALARPPQVRLDPVDLRRAVQLAVESAPVEVQTVLPADLPPARGEEHYVVQVLVNLMTNAARAAATRVEVAGRREGENVVLEVRDDGRGAVFELRFAVHSAA